MRIDIPSDIPQAEALARAAGRKIVGRKHNHQPRGKARERQRARIANGLKLRDARKRKHRAKVKAYWAGERDTHP